MSKKLIALTLAVAFAFPFVSVQAATVEELQALINSLNQQIAALQQQLASLTGGSASTATYCFTTDLKKGMTSNDVKNLQIVLNKDAATQVATTGAGSPGNETTYFGALTEAAVKKYQAANGISPVSGYVGPLTRASLNAKYCNPVTPPTTAPTTPPTTVAPSYGTLSVQKYPLSSAVTNLYGNNTYEVLAAQYKATGSDITLKKIAVQLRSTSAFPWQYFTSLSVWDGATKLGEAAVTQANLIEDSFATNYTLNISGLNYVIPSGTQKVLTIKATIVPTVVTEKSYIFRLVNEQTVYTDTAGVTYTNAGTYFDSDSFTIKNANIATLTVTAAIDNPLAGNIIGSISGTVKADLLKFNVKVDDVNVTLNSATATVTYTGTPQLSSLELWDGSTLVASAGAPAASGTVSWTNFNLPISAGTTKTLVIKGVLKQLTSGYTGGDKVNVSNPTLTGMDANSNAITKYGTVAGADQTIYLVAPSFALSGTPTFTSSGDTNHPQSIGTAKIAFTVTANGGDIYINSSSTLTYNDVTPSVSAPNTIANGFTCTSNATLGSGYWRIVSGATALCEIDTTVQLATTTAGTYYQAQVGKITWNTSATTTSDIEQTYGWDNFKTGLVYLAY